MPIVALALVVVAMALVLGIRSWRTRTRPAAVSPPDSAAALDPRDAIARAVALEREGHALESLPFFRRGVAAQVPAVAHWNLAAAMNNAANEVGGPRGVARPATRSALERVELVLGALDELVLARGVAAGNADVARLEVMRGRTLQRWGFAYDALAAYRAALAADPGSATALAAEAEVRDSLRR